MQNKVISYRVQRGTNVLSSWMALSVPRSHVTAHDRSGPARRTSPLFSAMFALEPLPFKRVQGHSDICTVVAWSYVLARPQSHRMPWELRDGEIKMSRKT
jgi:hypothetical protein